MKSPIKHIVHVCNPGATSVTGWQQVSSTGDLQALNIPDREVIWVINTLLEWEFRSAGENYGFDIARHLRLIRRSKAPIIFYSVANRNFFELLAKEQTKYLLFFGRGTGFLQAPFLAEEFEKMVVDIKPLSASALHDVTTMLCGLKGIVVDQLNHDLKYTGNSQKVAEVFNGITPYLSFQQKQIIELDHFRARLSEASERRDEEEFSLIRRQFLNLCQDQLHDNEGPELIGSKTGSKARYRVLVLEDSEEDLRNCTDHLAIDFEVIPCSTADEAIKALDADHDNSITAVISDWRLYDAEKGRYWQSLQGYEVLELAAENGFRALFALTGQADFIIHQIRNQLGLKFTIVKKDSLKETAHWKLFREMLRDACQITADQRPAALDAFAKWNKVIEKNGESQLSLKQQYIIKWNSLERDSYFRRIDVLSQQMIDYIKQRKHNDPPLNDHFGLTLSTKGPFILFNVLVYRRVWVALWFTAINYDAKTTSLNPGKTSEEIYKKMFSYYPSGSDASASAEQNNFKLCLTPVDVHQLRILPEEKAWLIDQGLMEMR